jgi:hypothetical protein
MSITYGLAGSSPLADFSVDPEDLVYKYLGTNWSITSPTHITKQELFRTTDPAQMINRPDPGDKSQWLWVRHFQMQSGRDLFGSTIGTHGMIRHNHLFDIHLLSNRLVWGLTFPDLGQISREVERLIYQCQEGQIEGIQQFNSFTLLPVVEASVDWGEGWAGTYRATCQVLAIYHKYSSL